jgi:hypothetical protein
MPDKTNLRRWVSALRSGQYQQGPGLLRSSDNKYCCLGVALDLALANGVTCKGEVRWGATASLPREVTDWFGVNTLNIRVWHDLAGCPSSLNDRNVSFLEIANAIESTYKLKED